MQSRRPDKSPDDGRMNQLRSGQYSMSEMPSPCSQSLIALRRRSSNIELHDILSMLEQRLRAQDNSYDCDRALAFIADYSHHLDVRANLPPQRLSRLPAILRELLSMRYHEYANGFKSAAKDLVS